MISIDLYSLRNSLKLDLKGFELYLGNFFPFFNFVLSIISRESWCCFLGSLVYFLQIIGVEFVRFMIVETRNEGSFDHFGFFFYKYYKGSEFCLKLHNKWILIISDPYIIPLFIILISIFLSPLLFKYFFSNSHPNIIYQQCNNHFYLLMI